TRGKGIRNFLLLVSLSPCLPLPSPAHQIYQRPQADACRADRQIRLAVFIPGRARDVQVSPGRVFGEFTDEISAGDSSRFASAHVFDVGDLALDLFAVIFVERQLPYLFAGLLGGGQDLIDPRLVGSEKSDVNVAERDRDGAGQRRQIDDPGRAEFARISYGVGQYQSALGVGVYDLD